jgi:hypothetical protein
VIRNKARLIAQGYT